MGGLALTLVGTRRPEGASRGRLARTPVRLQVVAAAVLVCGIAFGAVTAIGAASRSAAVDDAITRAEPLSASARTLYLSLSDADITAATVFLANGSATPAERQRYNADITAVTTALSALNADSTGPRTALGVIAARIPVYTSLISTAQADNRDGMPVAAAYLREASALLHDQLLPAASTVYQAQAARLADDDSDVAALPIVELVLLAALLAVLVGAQRYLWLRTRRRVNPGLLAATVLVLAVGLWTGIAVFGARGDIRTADSHGRAAIDVLARAHLAASQAHDDEVLGIAANGEDHGAYAKDFTADSRTAAAELAHAPAVPVAAAAERSWFAEHDHLWQVQTGLQQDNTAYLRTLAQLTGSATTGPGAEFARVDRALTAAVDAQRGGYVNQLRSARGDLTGLAIGVAVLTAFAATAGVLGIERRLREYR